MSSEVTQTLDCSGKDSGREECWPKWVNIGVPVMVSVAFLLVLLIMFVVWPKKPQEEEEEEAKGFVPGKWSPKDRFEIKSFPNNNASTSAVRQIDENNV